MTIKHQIKFKTDKKPVDYQAAIDFMEEYSTEIISGTKEELIWLTSHPPIYTAGVSAKDEDLLNHNVSIYKTNRGGKYTYHDPGMRIIYIILNLKNCFAPNPPDIAKFVNMLEKWIIAILDKFGIRGEIRKNRVGVWVECYDPRGKKTEKKIAAIGIKVRKWVSYHGIAININPNFDGFKNIVPCGIKDFGITSFSDLDKDTSFSEIDRVIIEEFFKIFDNYKN